MKTKVGKIFVSLLLTMLIAVVGSSFYGCDFLQREDPSTVQVNNVIALISKIPDPAPTDLADYTKVVKENIVSARAAYDKLTETLKERITNYEILLNAESKLASLEDEAEVQAVVDLINKIPDVTKLVYADIAKYIKPANTAYKSLTAARQAMVPKSAKEDLDKALTMQGHLEKVNTCADLISRLTSETVSYDKLLEIDNALSLIMDNTDQRLIWNSQYKDRETYLATMREVSKDKDDKKYATNVKVITDIIAAINNTRNASAIIYSSQDGYDQADGLLDIAEAMVKGFVELSDTELNTIYKGKKEDYQLQLVALDKAKDTLVKNRIALDGENSADGKQRLQYGAIDVLQLYNKIKALGTPEVTPPYINSIDSCINNYNLLTDFLKEQLSNYNVLVQKKAELDLLTEYINKANAIVYAIQDIGKVTLSSEAKILVAREMYDHPTDKNGNEYSAEEKDKIRAHIAKTHLDILVAAENTLATLKKESADKAVAANMATKITALCNDPVTIANYENRKRDYENFLVIYNDPSFTQAQKGYLNSDYPTVVSNLTSFIRKLALVEKVYNANILITALYTLDVTLSSEAQLSEAKAKYDAAISDGDYPNSTTPSYFYLSKEDKQTFENNYAQYYTPKYEELNRLKNREVVKKNFVDAVKSVLTAIKYTTAYENESQIQDIIDAYDATSAKSQVNSFIDSAMRALNGTATQDGVAKHDGLVNEVMEWKNLAEALNNRKLALASKDTAKLEINTKINELNGKTPTLIANYATLSSIIAQIESMFVAFISNPENKATEETLPNEFGNNYTLYLSVKQALTTLEGRVQVCREIAEEMDYLPLAETLTKDTIDSIYNAAVADLNAVKIKYLALPQEEQSYIKNNHNPSYKKYETLLSKTTSLKPLRAFIAAFSILPTEENVAVSDETNVKIAESLYLTTLTSAQQSEVREMNDTIKLLLKMIEFKKQEAIDLYTIQQFLIRVVTPLSSTQKPPIPMTDEELQLSDETALKNYEIEFAGILSIYTMVRYKNMTYEALWVNSQTANDIESFKTRITGLRVQMTALTKKAADVAAVTEVAKAIFDINVLNITYRSADSITSAKNALISAQTKYNNLNSERKADFDIHCPIEYRYTTVEKHGISGIDIVTWMVSLSNIISQEEVKLGHLNQAKVWANTLKMTLPNLLKPNTYGVDDYYGSVVISIMLFKDQVSDPDNANWVAYINYDELGFDAIAALNLAGYMYEAKLCNDEIRGLYNESIKVTRSNVPDLLARIVLAMSDEGKYAKLDASVKNSTVVKDYNQLQTAYDTVYSKDVYYKMLDSVEALIKIVIDLNLPTTITNNDAKTDIYNAYSAFIKLSATDIQFLPTGYDKKIKDAYTSFSAYETALINSFKQRVSAIGENAKISNKTTVDDLILEYESIKYDEEQKDILLPQYQKLLQFQQDIITLITADEDAFKALVDNCPNPEDYNYATDEVQVSNMLAYYKGVDSTTAHGILGAEKVNKVLALETALLKGKVKRVADYYNNIVASGNETDFTFTHFTALNIANSAYASISADNTLASYILDNEFTSSWTLKDYYNGRKPQIEEREAVITLINSIPTNVNLDDHRTKVYDAQFRYQNVCNANILDKNRLEELNLLSKINDAIDQLLAQESVAILLSQAITDIQMPDVTISTAFVSMFNSLKSQYNALGAYQKSLILGTEDKITAIQVDVAQQQSLLSSIEIVLGLVPVAASVTLAAADGHGARIGIMRTTLDELPAKMLNEFADVALLKYAEILSRITAKIEYTNFLQAEANYQQKLQKVKTVEDAIDALNVQMGGVPQSETFTFVFKYAFVADYTTTLNMYKALLDDEKSVLKSAMKTFLINNENQMIGANNSVKSNAERFINAVANRETPVAWVNYGKALTVESAFNSMSADLQDEFRTAADGIMKQAYDDYTVYKSQFQAFEDDKVNTIITRIKALQTKQEQGTIVLEDRQEAIAIDALYLELDLYTALKTRVENNESLYTIIYKQRILPAIQEKEVSSSVFASIDVYYAMLPGTGNGTLSHSHKNMIVALRTSFNALPVAEQTSQQGDEKNTKLQACEIWIAKLQDISTFISKVNSLHAKVSANPSLFTIFDKAEVDACTALKNSIEGNSEISGVFALEVTAINKYLDCVDKLSTLDLALAAYNAIAALELIGKAGLTTSDQPAVTAARTAYEALNSLIEVTGHHLTTISTTAQNQKLSVTNYSFLVSCEAIMQQLIDVLAFDNDIADKYSDYGSDNPVTEATVATWQSTLIVMRSTYEAFDAVIKAKIVNYAKLVEMETAVYDMNRIIVFKSSVQALLTDYQSGAMTIVDHKTLIEDARMQYTALSLNARSNATTQQNLGLLVQYEAYMVSLGKVKELSDRIAALNAKMQLTLEDEAVYNAIRATYLDYQTSDVDAYNLLTQNELANMQTIATKIQQVKTDLVNNVKSQIAALELKLNVGLQLTDTAAVNKAYADLINLGSLYSEITQQEINIINDCRTIIENMTSANNYVILLEDFITQKSTSGTKDAKKLTLSDEAYVTTLRSFYMGLTAQVAIYVTPTQLSWLTSLELRISELKEIKKFKDNVNALFVSPHETIEKIQALDKALHQTELIVLETNLSIIITHYNGLSGRLKTEIQTESELKLYYDKYLSVKNIVAYIQAGV